MSTDTPSTHEKVNVTAQAETSTPTEPASQAQGGDSARSRIPGWARPMFKKIEAQFTRRCSRIPIKPLVLAWGLLVVGLFLLLGGVMLHFYASKPSTEGASAVLAQAASTTALPHPSPPAKPPEDEAKPQENLKATAPPPTQSPQPMSSPTSEPPSETLPIESSAKAPTEEGPPAEDSLDIVFGADHSGNGVPDQLDRWIHQTFLAKKTQQAAQAYFRSALPLANKAFQGITLSKNEKQMVLRRAECYLVTAYEAGLPSAPNLNDRVLMMGGEAVVRMKALFKELQGFDYTVVGNSAGACVMKE